MKTTPPKEGAKRMQADENADDNTVLDAYVVAASQMLGLRVEPTWKPAVKANLEANLRHAAAVGETGLPDEAEPAPVFGA